MMVADEIRALLLIHDRLNAWERPFIRDMAKRLEQRRSLTVKQLATVRRILDRYRVWTVQVQGAPDQPMLLAEPVIRIPGEGLGLDSCAVAKRVGWCAMSRGGEAWRGLLVKSPTPPLSNTTGASLATGEPTRWATMRGRWPRKAAT